MPNAVPLTEICEIVTGLFPVFVSVIPCETALLVATVPKLTLEGPTEMAKLAAATSPVTGSAAVTPAVFVDTETDPVNAPVAFGVNCTVNVPLVPGFNSVEPENPLMLNPVPVAAIPVTVSASSPVFETVSDWALCTPATAEEKLMLDGVTSSRGVSTNEGALVAIGVTMQPYKKGMIATTLAATKINCRRTLFGLASVNRRVHPAFFTLISKQSSFQPGASL